MKMIVAILPDSDNDAVSDALIREGFSVTTVASTGGILRSGTSTLMVGVQDNQVSEAIKIVKENCAPPPEPGLKRGSVFVLNVAQFKQL